jgi:hypothetical protein
MPLRAAAKARRASELGSRELNSAARMRICSANTKHCPDYTSVLVAVEQASASCLMCALYLNYSYYCESATEYKTESATSRSQTNLTQKIKIKLLLVARWNSTHAVEDKRVARYLLRYAS